MKGVYQVEECGGVFFLYREQHYVIDCDEIRMEERSDSGAEDLKKAVERPSAKRGKQQLARTPYFLFRTRSGR